MVKVKVTYTTGTSVTYNLKDRIALVDFIHNEGDHVATWKIIEETDDG